jgi:hypothetical protein
LQWREVLIRANRIEQKKRRYSRAAKNRNFGRGEQVKISLKSGIAVASMRSLGILCLLALPISGCHATETKQSTQPLLTKTGGFDVAYMYSFMLDECGDYALGKKYREAIIAKVESCPFTGAAKADFYKGAALTTNEVLSGFTAFLFTHPQTKFVPRKDAHCENLNKPESQPLLRRLKQYDAGKIKPTEVLVDFSGKPYTCEQASKEGFEVAPNSSNGVGGTAGYAVPASKNTSNDPSSK